MNSETPPSTMLEEELTPTNYEAEESVLGAILMNPQALYDVLPILQKTQFASLRSRWVWDAIIAIHNRHEAIDAITVANELENQGNLANVGGSRYLNDLLDAVPSAINAVSYARIVEQAAIRRRLLDAATSIANLARSQNETIETVLNRSEAAVFAVSEHRITREIQPASDVARVYYDQVQRLSQLKDEYLGIPTGFSLIDRYLNGLQKQDLVIVAGRPGMGKTKPIGGPPMATPTVSVLGQWGVAASGADSSAITDRFQHVGSTFGQKTEISFSEATPIMQTSIFKPL